MVVIHIIVCLFVVVYVVVGGILRGHHIIMHIFEY